MIHIWLRAEERANEQRSPLTPDGVGVLINAGFQVTVEKSAARVLPLQGFVDAGASIAEPGNWYDAPDDAIILGLKELPDNGRPLRHTHIMFGHAYKGQPAGQRLLEQFRKGRGRLWDIEYLTDRNGRRRAAFGYWAGYVGAAMALHCWFAQQSGQQAAPVESFVSAEAMHEWLAAGLRLCNCNLPTIMIIGALGRVGSGASDLCQVMGIAPTQWDMAETAHGGPFPEILAHDIFLNCILAGPETPIFVPAGACTVSRRLSVIGDIACDPGSNFSPIKVYNRPTTWANPALRVHGTPPLDVTAIDNLPSLLPTESTHDFAAQLLPVLLELDNDIAGTWAAVDKAFDSNCKRFLNI